MPKAPQASDYSPEEAWRLERLTDLGFKMVWARELVGNTDVEHAARELLDKGCSPRVAYLILRE